MKILALLISLIFITKASAETNQQDYYSTEFNIAFYPNTSWTEDILKDHFKDVNRVFKQCGLEEIKFNIIHVNNVTLPKDLSGRLPYAENGIVQIANQTKDLPKPLIHLIESISDTGALTRAVFRLNVPPCPIELENSIWLPFEINTQAYKDARKKSPYSTFAHEMTHLLTMDGQHNAELPRNQLSIWKVRTDLLTTEMCNQIHESVFVKKHSRAKTN